MSGPSEAAHLLRMARKDPTTNPTNRLIGQKFWNRSSDWFSTWTVFFLRKAHHRPVYQSTIQAGSLDAFTLAL